MSSSLKMSARICMKYKYMHIVHVYRQFQIFSFFYSKSSVHARVVHHVYGIENNEMDVSNVQIYCSYDKWITSLDWSSGIDYQKNDSFSRPLLILKRSWNSLYFNWIYELQRGMVCSDRIAEEVIRNSELHWWNRAFNNRLISFNCRHFYVT